MQIKLSPEADLDFKNIEEYLFHRWSYAVLADLYDKYDRALEIICSEIAIFSEYENTGYRKYLVTKHNTIIYKIENNTVYIVRILQNFKNPEENLKYFDDED